MKPVWKGTEEVKVKHKKEIQANMLKAYDKLTEKCHCET